jgi:4-hydroxy-2-oxoheptanedioate aldolase
MQPNRVKKILREGGLALGTYVGGIAEPQIVEIIGHAGFDAAFIDLEHTSFDLRDVQLMVMAAERVGITPIVRTPGFDPAFILRLLDMGVQGIQVPHISDARAAREAVQAVRYAPLGDRGMAGASRASDYGVIPMREHLEQSNREITLAVMVEDLPALAEIDADRGYRRASTSSRWGHRTCRGRSAWAARPTTRSSSTSSIGSRRRCRRAVWRGSRCR